jgi:iron complex transport system permease protein
MPRTLAALIVGCGLALAGCAFQALLRNPLAEPYTLGISSAGALGAWTATILVEGTLHFPSSLLGVPTIQFCAFSFAIADVVIVYLLAARRSRVSPSVLLLSGVTLGLLANSGILLMRYLADPQRLVSMDRWLMGGVDVLGYQKEVIPLFIGVAPCIVILLAQASKFDQLGFGAEIAAGRGVNVTRLQFITFGVGSFLTAIIVSKVGPIGFVGLIVPHLVRGVTGSRHRILMPLTALAGGAFLCFCDIVARKILPGETPIGIVTTIIGGPFFLFLLMRRRFTDWQT